MGHPEVTLPERLHVEALLDDAFEPLRSRRAGLSPLRVRAAVRWGRGAPPAPLRWSRAASRLTEVSLALGMAVMVFVAAFGPSPSRVVAPGAAESGVHVAHVNMPLDESDYTRWQQLTQVEERAVNSRFPTDIVDPTVLHLGKPDPILMMVPPPQPPHEPS